MTDNPKKPRTMEREPWYDRVPRMSPEKELRTRRELGGTRIRFIPKRPTPPEDEEGI